MQQLVQSSLGVHRYQRKMFRFFSYKIELYGAFDIAWLLNLDNLPGLSMHFSSAPGHVAVTELPHPVPTLLIYTSMDDPVRSSQIAKDSF